MPLHTQPFSMMAGAAIVCWAPPGAVHQLGYDSNQITHHAEQATTCKRAKPALPGSEGLLMQLQAPEA